MTATSFQFPEAIASADWLEANLENPDLRVFDCTTYLVIDEPEYRPYRVVSGREDYEAGHIPGASFLDLQEEFSVKGGPYRFTLPSVEEAIATFERHGIDQTSRVVLYSRKSMMWATRFWWMLRWIGFDNAAILDGGYDKWQADGRPVSSEAAQYPAGALNLQPRPDLFVGKQAVLDGIGAQQTCTINALSPALHSGEDPRYGRPGRVPGSVNVPATSLLDPKTLEILAPDTVGRSFEGLGLVADTRIICYCGGGIAATMDAFLLHQLGYQDIAVYDNSMSEWATDDTLPMETG